MLVGTVYLDLIELWELDTEVGRTELFDFLNATWCLLAKLVAGEIENLQTCGLVLLVQLFELFVLRVNPQRVAVFTMSNTLPLYWASDTSLPASSFTLKS